MKQYLTIIICFFLGLHFAEAQTTSAVFVSPVFEISEMDANVSLGKGMAAGTVQGNWHIAAFGMRTTNASQINDIGEWYKLNLTSGGLWVTYHHPIGNYLDVSAGMKIAVGQLEREWNYMNEFFGLEKANLQMLTPEVGIEFALSPHLLLSYTSGFRWITQIDAITDVKSRDLHSLSNAITIKWILFGQW